MNGFKDEKFMPTYSDTDSLMLTKDAFNMIKDKSLGKYNKENSSDFIRPCKRCRSCTC